MSADTETYPQFKDDRTPKQHVTHTELIGGLDTFMSGWGRAEGKRSFAYWACEPSDVDQVRRWVRGRGDIQMGERHEAHCDHGDALVHIYVVTPTHPALS